MVDFPRVERFPNLEGTTDVGTCLSKLVSKTEIRHSGFHSLEFIRKLLKCLANEVFIANAAKKLGKLSNLDFTYDYQLLIYLFEKLMVVFRRLFKPFEHVAAIFKKYLEKPLHYVRANFKGLYLYKGVKYQCFTNNKKEFRTRLTEIIRILLNLRDDGAVPAPVPKDISCLKIGRAHV